MIYKEKVRVNIISLGLVFFVLLLCVLQIELGSSLRVSRKCQYGHYYNDGCVSCWCDPESGHSVCEHMTSCPRKKVRCPMGRKYWDECENECSCYETTGAIFCKEKGQCNSVRRRNIKMEAPQHPAFSNEDFELDHHRRLVPDSVSIPKEDLIIEPALIIRRKSFKNGNREMEHQTHHDPSKKNSNTLLYLYEKQLKSMKEFRNYYNQYINNNEDVHSKNNHQMQSSSNYMNSYVRRPAPSMPNIKVHIPLNPMLFPFRTHHKKMKPGQSIPSPSLRPPPTTPAPRPPSYDWSAAPSNNPVTFRPYPTSFSNVTHKPYLPSISTQGSGGTIRPYGASTRSNITQPVTLRPYLTSASSISQRPFTSKPFHSSSGNGLTLKSATSLKVTTPSNSPFKVTIQNTLVPKSADEHSRPNYLKNQSIPSEITIRKAIEEDPTPYLGWLSTISPLRFSSTSTTTTTKPPTKEDSISYESYEYEDATESTIRPFVSSTTTQRPITKTQNPITFSASTSVPKIYSAAIKSGSRFPDLVSRPYSTIISGSRPYAAVAGGSQPYSTIISDAASQQSSASGLRPYSTITGGSRQHLTITRAPPHFSTFRSTTIPQQQLFASPSSYPSIADDGPVVSTELKKPIFLNHIMATRKYPEIYSPNNHFPHYITKPKQYRLILKNEDKKPLYYSNNNRVPQFVDKIAREFFKKPAIFIPRIKHGPQPGLELERVVYHHKDMIPNELILEPGGQPMKVKFSPGAERQMDREWRNAQHHMQHTTPKSVLLNTRRPVHHPLPKHIHSNHDEHLPTRESPCSKHHHHHSSSHSEQNHHQNSYTKTHLSNPEISQYNTNWKYNSPSSVHNSPPRDYESHSESPQDYHESHSEFNTQGQSPSEDYEGIGQLPVIQSEYHESTKDYEPIAQYTATEPEADYVPVSPRPGPLFELRREEIDDFSVNSRHDTILPQEEDHSSSSILIDSIDKAPKVMETHHSTEIKQSHNHHPPKNRVVKIERQEIHELFSHKTGPEFDTTEEPTIRSTTYKPQQSYSIPAESSEIDHDQIIREILSMDPEIGTDSYQIIKSDGQAVPTHPTTTTKPSSVADSMQIQATNLADQIIHENEDQTENSNLDYNSESNIPQINLKADSGIINFDYSSETLDSSNNQEAVPTTTTVSPFDTFYKDLFKDHGGKDKADAVVDTDAVAKIFNYELQKSHQIYESSSIIGEGESDNGSVDSNSGGGGGGRRTLDKREKTISSSNETSSSKAKKSAVVSSSSLSTGRQEEESVAKAMVSSTKEDNKEVTVGADEDPTSSFKKELDWKSNLMSNICDINPESALCFTYKSLCLLMST